MASFTDILNNYNWENIKQDIYSKTRRDVEIALSKSKRTLEDFKALVSPTATAYLEQMAELSHQSTQKRFGKIIQLYIPLYLSNDCENCCIYCGFNRNNKIERVVLTDKQIIKEVKEIKAHGFEHILLVTGESPEKAGIDYLKNVFRLISPYFSLISIEVQPLEQKEYEELITLNLHTVYIYQETYNRERYKIYHPSDSRKSDFDWRLQTPDRLGKAGVYKTGLGILLGLEDWRIDAFFLALHLSYLEKQYWKTRYSVSFPRLRPYSSPSTNHFTNARGTESPSLVEEFRIGFNVASDKDLVQMLCAFRLFNEEVELTLSTRESANFRNNAIKLGITTMSAGSKTHPGAYGLDLNALEQFEVNDSRNPSEIQEIIKSNGYEAVWKDWDKSMQSVGNRLTTRPNSRSGE